MSMAAAGAQEKGSGARGAVAASCEGAVVVALGGGHGFHLNLDTLMLDATYLKEVVVLQTDGTYVTYVFS